MPFRIAVLAVILGLTGGAVAWSGPIAVHPDVNGIGAFVDQGTGLIWARLDNYFGVSYNYMQADLAPRGFIVATQAQVETLLGSLPLDAGQWTTYAHIMGRAPNRDLIWGAFESTTHQEWAWSWYGSVMWHYTSGQSWFGLDEVPNAGTPHADLNMWAVYIPEPSPVVLVAAGGLALIALRRRMARR